MISFEDKTGQQCFARWSDLKALLKAEEDSLIKLSKLNFKSVHAKPVERQNVNLCLNVFSDETVTALQTHTHYWMSLIQQELFSLSKCFCSFGKLLM